MLDKLCYSIMRYDNWRYCCSRRSFLLCFSIEVVRTWYKPALVKHGWIWLNVRGLFQLQQIPSLSRWNHSLSFRGISKQIVKSEAHQRQTICIGNSTSNAATFFHVLKILWCLYQYFKIGSNVLPNINSPSANVPATMKAWLLEVKLTLTFQHFFSFTLLRLSDLL